MQSTTGYALTRTTTKTFDDALAQVREALSAEGFGVLCEIDVQATLREKLGVETGRHLILGACNPPLAHQALEAERDLGVLLPCNVVVYRDSGGTVVAALDPATMVGLTDNPALVQVAEEARGRLQRVIDLMTAEETDT